MSRLLDRPARSIAWPRQTSRVPGLVRSILFLSAVTAIGLPATAQMASAEGERLLAGLRCGGCHGKKGGDGPLAVRLDSTLARAYSPSAVGAVVWNHVPMLAARPEGRAILERALNSNEATALFAYFAASRYFERPGDARRGKQIFQFRKCGACHGPSAAEPGRGGPLTAWGIAGDPVGWAGHLWNHATQMRQAARQAHIPWSPLNSQELTDLQLYLRYRQGLRMARKEPAPFSLGSPEAGGRVFRAKGCANCHAGAHSLGRRSQRTLTDFAAAMGSHKPRDVRAFAPLDRQETGAIAAYLWSVGYFDMRGRPSRGARLFARKNCAGCHDGSPGPALSREALASRNEMNPISAAVIALDHGPEMLNLLRRKHLAWPRLKGPEMADLAAYLSTSAAEAAPIAAGGAH